MRWKLVVGIAAGVVVALGAALGGLVAWGGPLADIRPAAVDVSGAGEAQQAKGRALLEQAYAAHGGEAAWTRHDTQSLTMRDEWPGWYAGMSPWPSGDETVRIVQRRHSFDSRVTFDDGAAWGIVDGRGWSQPAGGSAADDPSPDIQFMLPTVHYFIELPQRIREAEKVAYVGTETLGGREYEVVYATWGSWAANDAYDQYLVFIDPETHRIAKIEYTVREIMRFVQATAHMDTFVEVDGLVVASRYTVTNARTDDPDAPGYLHRMTVSDFRVDADDAEVFTRR